MSGIILGSIAALTSPLPATDLAPGHSVIISEISYNPPATLGSDGIFEFVELHNRGAAPVDVSSWRFRDQDDAHDFTLPDGHVIPPGGYLVLTHSADSFREAYGVEIPIVGGFGFSLGNGGDTVRILDARGMLIDRVNFDDDLPWPAEADGEGSTLERISTESDATDFSNFAPSAPSTPPGTPGAANSRAGWIPRRHSIVINEIQYNPVVDPDADSQLHCPSEEFVELYNRGNLTVDLSGWSFREGVEFVFPEGATLSSGAYLAVYRDREAFAAKYGSPPGSTGPYERTLDDGGEDLLLVDQDGRPVDYVDYGDGIPWPIRPDGLRGSIELIDPWSDNDRGRAWAASAEFTGSPGSVNSATRWFMEAGGNSGPQITRVAARIEGDPERDGIRSVDPVEIAARVFDREGVASVHLEYQVCVAGDYITKSEPRFATEWKSIEMNYDAARARYTATLDPHPHRTLVRYRIVAVDAAPDPLEAYAPRRGDPEPNFAYFVYDGVPDYIAGERSAFGDPGYVHTDLDRIPVYFIVGREQDIEELYYRRFAVDDRVYRWEVSFVHEGRVHDHVRIRLRSSHRYSWPKRPLKIRFNKGNLFRGRFNDGTRYPRGRSRINLNTAIHDADKPRGEGGVFETLAWRLYHEADVMTAATTLAHLRIVRSPEEHHQFLGDFHGIYVDVQRLDATALRDRGRPAGSSSSLYKMRGYADKKHPDCDPSTADVDAFIDGYAPSPRRQWYEQHLNVERYVSFRTVSELVDNHDMDSLKNFYYYYDGEREQWEVVPWDLDNTFGATASGDDPLARRVLPLFQTEFRNRFRFLWQVLYDEQRLFSLVDELADLMGPVANADMDRWDTEPRQACPRWPETTGGDCERYQPFERRMRDLKRWIRSRSSRLSVFYLDPQIPRTPSNLSPVDGAPTNEPVVLTSSEFADPVDGDRHARSRWMVIEKGGDWASPLWDETTEVDLIEVTLPVEISRVGREYLFRVAYEDSTGRWSFLSEPTSFSVGPLDRTPPRSPTGIAAERISARAIVLGWEPSTDPESGIFGYRVARDGEMLSPLPRPGEQYSDFGPLTAGSHVYQVVAVNRAGLESTPSSSVTVDVPAFASLGGWEIPASGFAYFYDALPGQDLYTAERGEDSPFNLDGTWARSGRDDWDGSGPGDAGSAPGGIWIRETEEPLAEGPAVSVLSFEDPGDPSDILPTPNNRRLHLVRDVGERNPLEEGVTLVARWRVTPDPIDLPGAKGQSPERSGPRGHLGLAHHARDGRQNFFVWIDESSLSISGGESTPVEMTEFQTIWVTIEPEGGDHRVRLYLQGRDEPIIDASVRLPSNGTESVFSGNYLQMGLANADDSGAIEVDYFGYLHGVHAPVPERVDDERLFVRGDVNGDRRVNLIDAARLLHHLFVAFAPLACPDAGDVDDSGAILLTDPVLLLTFAFGQDGRAPAAPFPDCSVDGTPDSLETCAERDCE